MPSKLFMKLIGNDGDELPEAPKEPEVVAWKSESSYVKNKKFGKKDTSFYVKKDSLLNKRPVDNTTNSDKSKKGQTETGLKKQKTK